MLISFPWRLPFTCTDKLKLSEDLIEASWHGSLLYTTGTRFHLSACVSTHFPAHNICTESQCDSKVRVLS